MNGSLRSWVAWAAIAVFLCGGRVAGQTRYAAQLHDHSADHLNHGASGSAFLSLNRDRSRLSYRLEVEGLALKPNAAERTAPHDVIGIHMHLNVPGTTGPHVLNIFGLATYGMPAEEDADLVVDYASQSLSGVFDYRDATIDPLTGEPMFQFFPLTTKIIDDWLDELDAGDLMFAVHTVASGFPTMAIHGRIHAVPEPGAGVLAAVGGCGLWFAARRRRRVQIHRRPPRPICDRRRLPPWAVLAGCVVAAMPAATACAQPSAVGQWTGVLPWGQGGGIEAIHVHLLPTGKVMFWQTWRESIGLWDPVTQNFSTAALPSPSDFNPFCSGHAWLADGRLMVVGGHIENFNGLNRANIYNPFTNTWANNVPDMPVVPAGAPYGAGRFGRWYPSATTLGNGDILTLSGGMVGDSDPDEHPLPQIYQVATNSWRNLTTAYKEMPLYPRTFLAPDGRVVSLSNNGDNTEFLDTTGTGSWSYLMDTLDDNLVNYGPAVMYDTGKIAYIGGGHNPTQNISILDLTDPTPAWRYGADDMARPRRQNNATILADGTVLITGGSSIADWNDPAGRVTVPEIWDPETEQVTQVAGASDLYRGYHSTALLLPDGRVLVTGGDHDSNGFQSNKNAEIYSPAYLFKGPRPVVTAAPANAEMGETMFVQTPDGASIADALMIVPGSVTHAQDWTQRANHLDFAAVAGGINITLPANPNEAPPGYYMLFLVNDAGVPSIAKFFRAELPTVLAGDYNRNDVVTWRITLCGATAWARAVRVWRRMETVMGWWTPTTMVCGSRILGRARRRRGRRPQAPRYRSRRRYGWRWQRRGYCGDAACRWDKPDASALRLMCVDQPPGASPRFKTGCRDYGLGRSNCIFHHVDGLRLASSRRCARLASATSR